MKKSFVAGFLFDDQNRVVLVRKNRPTWQAGKLNAIGGKIEPGENSLDAMIREFSEEAGIEITHWDHFASIEFILGQVDFYRATVSAAILDTVYTKTDEDIEIHTLPLSPSELILPNLSWLIPLAQYTHDTYQPIIAREIEGDNTIYNL